MDHLESEDQDQQPENPFRGMGSKSQPSPEECAGDAPDRQQRRHPPVDVTVAGEDDQGDQRSRSRSRSGAGSRRSPPTPIMIMIGRLIADPLDAAVLRNAATTPVRIRIRASVNGYARARTWPLLTHALDRNGAMPQDHGLNGLTANCSTR